MEMGCGSGMTCWRQLHDWHEAGVCRRLHEILLAELNGAGQIDWSRASVDSRSLLAVGGGEKTGPSPVDRREKGGKHHVIVDADGTPRAAIVTAANVSDVKQLQPLVDGIPPIRRKRGRPRRRPKEVYADRASDSRPHRQRLRRRGIQPRIARRKTAHGTGLGRVRRIVERTLSWLPRKRKLRTRTERRADIHEALTSPGCALICFNVLIASLC